MPHTDIKYTADLDIDIKTLMRVIEEIILDLDPTAGVCKSRAFKIDEYLHPHVNIELRMYATKERDIELTNRLITRVDQETKSFMKSAAYVTVKLDFTPLPYLTGFFDPSVSKKC